MIINRFDIYPVNHQDGNEIERASGKYVRYDDIERSMAPVMSLVDEMLMEIEGLAIAAYGCVPQQSQDILDRAKQIMEQKK